jgi:hypothetical protein
MRPLGLVTMLVVSLSPAVTAEVRTDPPQPFYEGDFVRIEIDVSHPAYSYAAPDMLIENLDKHRVSWKHEPSRPRTLEITGWAISAGEISFVATRYQDAEGNLRDLPGMSFPVLPLPLGDDLNENFRTLERLGRSSIVLTTVLVDDGPVYPGSRVAVEWWSIAPAGVNLYMTLPSRLSRDSRNLPIEGAAEKRIFESRFEKIDASGGMLVKKRRIATYYLRPERAGVYQIPPFPFEGEDVRLRDARGHARMFSRMAPPLDVEVLPLPKEAEGLPIGTFTMECTAATIHSYWPAISVRVKGNGTLGGAPRFVSTPSVPVVSIPSDPMVDMYKGEQTLTSILRVQKREQEMKLPDIVYPYYNDEKNAVAELRCSPPPVSYRERSRLKTATAGVMPESEDAGWLSIAELVLVFILGLSLFAVRRAFRP